MIKAWLRRVRAAYVARTKKGPDPVQTAAALLVLAISLCLFIARAPKQHKAQPDPAADASAGGPLAGITVAIDPGHGGYDQGCEGRGVTEAPLNLDVSLRLSARLRELGANVVLTRETDTSLVDPNASGNRKAQDMALRKAVIDGCDPQILLSIHMNAYTSSAPSGALVYHHIEAGEDSKALSDAIQSAFHADDARHKKIAQRGEYYILSCCEPSALVECGFLSNPWEEALLSTEAYRQRLAEIIAQGVVNYWHPL